MKFSRRSVISVISGLLPLLALNHAAYAGSIIKVSLWDKGPTAMDMFDAQVPMGMAMSGAKTGMATMGITTDVLEIPAGEVTFRVINESQEFYHSMAHESGSVTVDLRPGTYILYCNVAGHYVMGMWTSVTVTP